MSEQPDVLAVVSLFLHSLQSSDEVSGSLSSGEIAYELDCAVSQFLGEHGLSVDQYQDIHQEVINTIATDLERCGVEGAGISLDDHGNALPGDVLAALDSHFPELPMLFDNMPPLSTSDQTSPMD